MASAWIRDHRFDGPEGALISRYVDYRLTGFAPGVHAGLPSRYLTLLVSLHDPIELVDADGAVLARHQALIAGLHTVATRVRHAGTQIGIQLGLDPLAIADTLGVPPAELAHGSYALGDVVRGADRLVERLWESDPGERMDLIGRAFRPGGGPAPPPEVVHAWHLTLRHQGTMGTADIAERIGWSRRHMSERFKAMFGWTPKEAARIMRFEHARRVFVHRPALGWAAVAVEAGYADQPHLVREWKRITGSSPTRWAAEEVLPFLQDDDVDVAQNRVHV